MKVKTNSWHYKLVGPCSKISPCEYVANVLGHLLVASMAIGLVAGVLVILANAIAFLITGVLSYPVSWVNPGVAMMFILIVEFILSLVIAAKCWNKIKCYWKDRIKLCGTVEFID